MRAFSRAQRLVSTIICSFFLSSSGGGCFDVRQAEFFAEQPLRPAHERYSHTDTLPAQLWYCRRRASFSRLIYRKRGTGMLARPHCRRSQKKIKCFWYNGQIS
jgi:hypothetical protein